MLIFRPAEDRRLCPCLLLGVRVAAGTRQSDVDGLDHRAGGVQPLRGHLQAVPGDPRLHDATGPSAGVRRRRRHHRLQHTALSRAPARLLLRGYYFAAGESGCDVL